MVNEAPNSSANHAPFPGKGVTAKKTKVSIKVRNIKELLYRTGQHLGHLFYELATIAFRLTIGLALFLFFPSENALALLRSRPNKSSFLTW